MIGVLVVDDQELVRSGLRALVSAEGDLEVVGEAADGPSGVRLARELRPDVVLMDIRMPGGEGLTATRAITADPALVGTKIIVLTGYDTDDSVMIALRSGASGYLLKDFEAPALLQAIRTAAAGDALLAPSIARRIATTWTPPGAPRTDPATERLLAGLTDREREVLALVARGRTNAELATDLHISLGTAKTHVSRILTKLSARDRVQLAILGHQAGLADPNRRRHREPKNG
ncbi:response regulator transcription factor [Kribbella hippodromi]|uniref:Response regulator transcription factor n=1 Tax=Kribbella hippodromi TaxID=434347 RepID=A0ABP4PWF4_9ACTN